MMGMLDSVRESDGNIGLCEGGIMIGMLDSVRESYSDGNIGFCQGVTV